MTDWNFALRLTFLSAAGTFFVMGVLTVLMSLVSRLIKINERRKQAEHNK